MAAAGSDGALKAGEIALALLKDGKADGIPTTIEAPVTPPALAGVAPGAPGAPDAPDAEPPVDGREGAKPDQRAQKNAPGQQKPKEETS